MRGVGNWIAVALTAVGLAACGGSAPAPPPETSPNADRGVSASAEKAIGSVKVGAATLNVRAESSASAAIVAHARRGERLAVLADTGDWLRVRLGDGTVGWVSSQHVVREGAVARPRRGCQPDSDFSFVKTPKPEFSQSQSHGMVKVDATVDAKGNVTSTRIISNSTGDDSLGLLAEREIEGARFSPPIRNCVPKTFIFSYKRSF